MSWPVIHPASFEQKSDTALAMSAANLTQHVYTLRKALGDQCPFHSGRDWRRCWSANAIGAQAGSVLPPP